ncbi:hypothetical protein [Pedobacter sp.]|uniref:hypothetical protein n=1 Tax=Pedobacter sp. TaxID=1411316 RepID=UPI003D7FBA0B
MYKNFFAACSLLFMLSCGHAEQQKQQPQHYFNLKGYFEQEALRLNKKNALVQKTVAVNEAMETKAVHIADWNKEFANFIDADINKSAWQGFFKVTKNKNQEIYTATQEKVIVKKLLITRKENKIVAIKVLLNTSNYLYQSTDSLSYYPDSLYEISKTQKIRLMGQKKYNIKGQL